MHANVKLDPADEIKVSACTIAKNEEDNIGRSIRSYKNYVDEIIVVDTGSTDKTVQIAKKNGAKVINFEWCSDFAKAKNAALEKASGDWIIFLDADEYFGKDTAKNIRKCILYAIEHDKNSIFCFMYNLDDPNDDSKIIATNKTLRIFKKGAKYRFPIHEALYIPDGYLDPVLFQNNLFYINHLGYKQNVIRDKGKRNTKLILDALKDTDSPTRKADYYFYLCDSYYSMENFAKSVEYGTKFLDFCREKKIHIEDIARRSYTNIYNSNNNLVKAPEESLALLEEFYEQCPDYVDSNYVLGDVYFKLQRFDDCIRLSKSGIKIIDDTVGTVEGSMGSHRASIVNLLGKATEGLLRDTEALDLYYKAAEDDNSCYDAAFNLLRMVKGYPKDKLNTFVEALYDGKTPVKKAQIIAGLMKNFMLPQIFRCYASIKATEKKNELDAQISAFIMLDKKNYNEAARLFIIVYKMNKSSDAATNGLICAMLAKNKTLIDGAKEFVSDNVRFALGLEDLDKKFTAKDISEVGTALVAIDRMGLQDKLLELITKACSKLNEKEIIKLARIFIFGYSFEAALFTVKQAPLSAESYYFQGYCLYRMKKISEGADLLKLSRNMGCQKPAISGLLENIQKLSEKLPAKLTKDQKANLKKDTEAKISQGDYMGASANIDKLLTLCEPDAETYALKAVLMFYCGLYKEAAAAAQCGLLRDSGNFDLLYNAGFIYDKLGDEETAISMFKKSLDVCKDEETKKSIKSILGAN